MIQIGESAQNVDRQFWSHTVSQSRPVLSQTNEEFLVDCRIIWTIQKKATELDPQIRTAVSLLLFEELRDLLVFNQVNLLQLFQLGQER